jgi:signal peptidase I
MDELKLDSRPDQPATANVKQPEQELRPQATAPTGGRSSFVKAWDFVSELLHVVVISLAIIVPVRYFLIQPFYVKGASMEPNFHDHQYLIIDEISYRFVNPDRGDIVVFRYPNDPRQYFIKRVIGLPGERVRVADGHVTIYNDEHPEGMVLDEAAYLHGVVTTKAKDLQLASDEYFVMGDNRTASMDSRDFGSVKRDFVVGRVWLRGWPPEDFKVFGDQSDSYNY